MNQTKEELIYDLIDESIAKIKRSAYLERELTESKSIDTLYAQVLNLLEEKRLRAESFLNRSKE